MQIKVFDHGYVKFIEAWGHGLEGEPEVTDFLGSHDYEVGIIEAARQSTQGAFRGWKPAACDCGQENQQTMAEIAWRNTPEPRSVLEDPPSIPHSRDCLSIKNPGDEKLLSFLYRKGHATPFEFAGMVVEIQAPIMVFREWHRHRTQSYSEASARYAPLPALNYHITDAALIERAQKALETKNRQASSNGNYDRDAILAWNARDRELSKVLQDHYHEGLEIGVPKELARKKMPVDHYSRMRACCNLRNWLAFMTLRLDPDAQEEIRIFATAVSYYIEKFFPNTYKLFSEDQA